MAGLDKKLRVVKLEQVAAYLKCDPERLRTALKHLATSPGPTIIDPSVERDNGVMVVPADDRLFQVAAITAPLFGYVSATGAVAQAEQEMAEKEAKEAAAHNPILGPVDPEAAKWLN